MSDVEKSDRSKEEQNLIVSNYSLRLEGRIQLFSWGVAQTQNWGFFKAVRGFAWIWRTDYDHECWHWLFCRGGGPWIRPWHTLAVYVKFTWYNLPYPCSVPKTQCRAHQELSKNVWFVRIGPVVQKLLSSAFYPLHDYAPTHKFLGPKNLSKRKSCQVQRGQKYVKVTFFYLSHDQVQGNLSFSSPVYWRVRVVKNCRLDNFLTSFWGPRFCVQLLHNHSLGYAHFSSIFLTHANASANQIRCF